MGDAFFARKKGDEEFADDPGLIGVVGLLRPQPILGHLLEADMVRDVAAGRAPIAARVFQPSLIGLHRQKRGVPLVVGAEAATRPFVAKLQQVPSGPAFSHPLGNPSLVRELSDVCICRIGINSCPIAIVI